jgi:hypothetical protein
MGKKKIVGLSEEQRAELEKVWLGEKSHLFTSLPNDFVESLKADIFGSCRNFGLL